MGYIIWLQLVGGSPNLARNPVGTVTSCTITQLFVPFMTSLVNPAPPPPREPWAVLPTDLKAGRPADNDWVCLSVPTA